MPWLELRQPVAALTHASWFFLAIPMTLLLWRLAKGEPVKQVGFAIFGLCLLVCYGSSMLWHGFGSDGNKVLAALDYAGIFALIAGTTTPILLVVLRGPWRTGSVLAVWLIAACGIILSIFNGFVSNKVFTVLYLGMGWGMCFSYFQLTRTLPHRKMSLVLAGGLLYSLGAILNWASWPVLLTNWVGPHEVFHVFVMAGSVAHFLFMVKVLLPFRHAAPALAPVGLKLGSKPVLSPSGAMASTT
jgi:hemolysin III